MKYNLAKYSQTVSNIVEGDIDLATDEIITIINSTNAQVPIPVSGTSGGTLVLDCDLGARVHIGEVQYYFDSVLPTSTAASGIKFYYKNEDFEVYVDLNTYYNENYYYTIVSGTSAPRYIRVEHTTVSGLGGYVNSLHILNDDTYVDFGDDGTDTNTNFNLSIENTIIEINDLEVFNSGPVKANAKLLIEPQNTIADDILSISDSVDGPWQGVYNDDDKVTGTDLWESGDMDDLEVYGNYLKLSPGRLIGTYTTRIINLEEDQRLTFNIMNYNYPTASSTSFISIDAEDTTETIEVRSSNSEPMPRESYIWMSGSYSPAYKYTNHSSIADGSVAEQSNDWGTWGRTGNYWEYWYDSVREDEYIIDKLFYTGSGSYTQIIFRIRKKSGTLLSATISNSVYTNDCFYSTYKVLPVSTGGFWINFFLARGNINTGTYYLRYYDSTMAQLYERQATASQGTFMYDMDVVYDTGHLWYTDRDISTVFKINTDGIVVASYLATQDIRGIVALADGGCWFIQQEALVRLDTNGAFVENIELPTDVASYIYDDLHGGFWLQEGENIYHLAADGRVYFSILIQGLLNVVVMDSGLLVKHHDGSTTTPPKASYISKDHRAVVRTWDYPQNEGGFVGTFDTNKYGARSHTYDDLVDDHASHFPIAIDNDWDKSEWTAVSLRDHNFTNEQYHQIRFKLRADNTANSPEVYGLWTQRAIEIPNINPNNYGKFYLKSDVTYLAPQDVRDYTSKIRAYWLLNTE